MARLLWRNTTNLPQWEATGDPQNETARNKEDYFEAVKARLHSADIRIADMDRNGVEMFIMSLTQPGIQEVLDTKDAVKPELMR